MFLELHMLQNFAPSNLNRDDTGAPKDCEFGGYRRARISSQCLKRAIRTTFKSAGLFTEDELAVRTKRLPDILLNAVDQAGKPREQASAVVETLLGGSRLKLKEGKTEYLLFLSAQEIDALAAIAVAHWDDLVKIDPSGAGSSDAGGKSESKKDKKNAAKNAVPKQVRDALERVFDGGRAADLALFGRMIADIPDQNVDAACQVAHALGTNRVSMEFDFFTAVDDKKPAEVPSADMLGTVQFNSTCFYRYANVDLGQLADGNLGGDTELARKTLDAFIRASIAAVPTGKQNSTAAQNPPSFVMAVVRDKGLWSLANAFLKPVRPVEDDDLAIASIKALDRYWGQLTTMYGKGSIKGPWVCALDDGDLSQLKDARVAKVEDLIKQVLSAAFPAPPA